MEIIMQLSCGSYQFDALLQSVLLEKDNLGENIIVITSKDYKIEELNILNVVERFNNQIYEQSKEKI